MKTMLKIVAVILGGTLAAANAAADPDAGQGRGDRGQTMQSRFKAADKDRDGKISKAEADAALPRIARRFADIDTNRDGFLTRDELRAWQRKHAGRTAGK